MAKQVMNVAFFAIILIVVAPSAGSASGGMISTTKVNKEYQLSEVPIESKKIVEHYKGFLNTDQSAFPTTDKRAGEDVRLLWDYGDPIENSHWPPLPDYAVEEVGLPLDYGDPIANSHSPPPPEYAVEDVGLPLIYCDPTANTLSPPSP